MIDGPSFEDRLKKIQRPLERYANKLAYNNPEDAKDLVQETNMRLWANRDKIDPNRPLEPYAFTTMRNVFNDKYRTQKRRIESDGAMDVDRIGDPVSTEKILKNLELKDVLRVIRQLPPEQGKVLLHSGYQYSYKEISEKLGIPIDTVGTRLLRGREALKKLLDEKDGNREYGRNEDNGKGGKND